MYTNDVNDVDGDDVTIFYKWILDGGPVAGTESTIPTSSIPFGTGITCEVTPFDGTDFGEPVSIFFEFPSGGGF